MLYFLGKKIKICRQMVENAPFNVKGIMLFVEIIVYFLLLHLSKEINIIKNIKNDIDLYTLRLLLLTSLLYFE